jgi:uncharacterized protein (TIRG00374 family)
MKRIILFLFSLLAGIALFFWVLRFTGIREIEKSLEFFGWNDLFVIVAVTLAVAVLGVWKWMEILKGEKVKVPFMSAFNSYMAGYAVMFLAPIVIWGGEAMRGYILKEKNGVPWTKGIASVIIDRIFEWTANLAVIIFGISFFLSKIYMLPAKLELFFGGVFCVFAGGIVFFYSRVLKKESAVVAFANLFGLARLKGKSSFLETEKEIFDFFHTKNKFLWISLGLNFVRAAAMWLRIWLLIAFLGKTVSVFAGISILGFSYLAIMVPIPASLGSQEAIQAFTFGALGLPGSSAVAFAMIIRAAEILISLLGVLILFRYGIYFIKKILFKKGDAFGPQ